MLDVANPRLAIHNIIFINHSGQVASYRMASPVVSHKARKQNFSTSEIAILTEKVEENLPSIQSKLTTSITNQKTNKYGVKLWMVSMP